MAKENISDLRKLREFVEDHRRNSLASRNGLEKKNDVLIEACKSAATELQRCRSVLLPQYGGCVGEPDSDVLKQIKEAVNEKNHYYLFQGEADACSRILSVINEIISEKES